MSVIKTCIMGLPMEPFTLAHVAVLNELKSPFLSPDTPAGFQDLLIAAMFCAHPEGKFPRNNWWLRFKIRLWLWRAMRLDWNREISAMRRHVASGVFALRDGIQSKGIQSKGAK